MNSPFIYQINCSSMKASSSEFVNGGEKSWRRLVECQVFKFYYKVGLIKLWTGAIHDIFFLGGGRN